MNYQAPPLRVFISHTSEFADFPENGSFVEAAMQAVVDCGHVPVEMRSFVLGSTPTADICERAVCSADIYLGILGHRYGSRLLDRDISYTEFEYQCAVFNRIPKLMFLLSGRAPVPLDGFGDREDGPRQDRFRAMARSAGAAVEFDSPGDLKYKVNRSLTVEALRINSVRSPAQLSRDQLRLALDERAPEVAWCSEYLAALVLGEKSEVPVTLDGKVIFVAIDVAYELVPDWKVQGLLNSWPRMRGLVSRHAERNALGACITEHCDTFRLMAGYLAAQQRTDPSIRERICAPARSPHSAISTTYHRPQARALLDSLWNDEDWPELERQASRWTDSKDPSLRRRARSALLAAIGARGPAQASRAALIASGFAHAPDGECLDLLQAATYAAIAGDLDAARRYVRSARERWPDDLDAKRLEARLCL